MRDRQEPGAQGCIKECGEEAREQRHSGHSLSPDPLVRYYCTLLTLFAASLPHCLTDAGTAEYVRQGAAAQ